MRARNTAKRVLSAQSKKTSPPGDYKLSYFNLCWSRMAVEGRKEAKETRRIVIEEMQSENTKKCKTRRESKVAGKLTNSNRGNCSNDRICLEGGAFIQCNTWMMPSLGRMFWNRFRLRQLMGEGELVESESKYALGGFTNLDIYSVVFYVSN